MEIPYFNFSNEIYFSNVDSDKKEVDSLLHTWFQINF